MPTVVSKEVINDLMDLQDDAASMFTQEHMLSGSTYWTAVECLAQTKLAELNGLIPFSPDHQRF